MSTTRSGVTVYCDAPGCPAKLVTARTTTAGARGDASRAGWALLLCAAGLAAHATTHTALYAQDAYDYGDPDD